MVAKLASPTRVKCRQRFKKDVTEIRDSCLDLIGYVETLVPQWPGLPKQGNLTLDFSLNTFSFLGFIDSAVSQSHQECDLVAMIDDALSANLRRVRGQDGNCSGVLQQIKNCIAANARFIEPAQHIGDRRTFFGRRALPVFGKIGEEGKEHEATSEGERVIET